VILRFTLVDRSISIATCEMAIPPFPVPLCGTLSSVRHAVVNTRISVVSSVTHLSPTLFLSAATSCIPPASTGYVPRRARKSESRVIVK